MKLLAFVYWNVVDTLNCAVGVSYQGRNWVCSCCPPERPMHSLHAEGNRLHGHERLI
jgi:hypothetical protein